MQRPGLSAIVISSRPLALILIAALYLPKNVTFLCGDVQSYPFQIGSFDVAFSRFGVMFFADPVAAFNNIRQALRPGGRLGFVCWRGLNENELYELPLRAASSCLPAPLVADTASSGWFSFSDQESIRETLDRARFDDVKIAPHDEQVRCGSFQATVDVCSRVGALGKILRDHPGLRSEAIPALEHLRARLKKSSDGDRQMVAILTAATIDGLDALEAAASEALDQGAISADVVLNILARSRSAPMEPTIATPGHLQLAIEPVANAGRYDRLLTGRRAA